jgi:hypothetical protein
MGLRGDGSHQRAGAPLELYVLGPDGTATILNGRQLTREELDRAFNSPGVLRFGRYNRGRARCVLCGFTKHPGRCERVYLDGHYRGYVCEECTGHNLPL